MVLSIIVKVHDTIINHLELTDNQKSVICERIGVSMSITQESQGLATCDIACTQSQQFDKYSTKIQ